MSREDDFDDIMDSRDTNTGHTDNTEPLLEDESLDESSGVQVETVPGAESEAEMPPPRRKPTAKKKKKAVKPARKPAKKKTAKKKTTAKKTTAKKKTAKKKKPRPAAKKKKARKAARKR
jgi:hypothetical protein